MSKELKKSAASVPIAVARETLLAEMAPPLRTEAQALGKVQMVEASGKLKVVFALGERLDAIVKAPEKFGDQAVSQLAAYFGQSEQVFRNAINIVQVFSKEDRATMLTRQAADGRLVGVQQLVLIGALATKTARDKMLERVYTHGLSERDLRTEIEASGLPKANPQPAGTAARGRKLKKPRTPAHAAAEVVSTTARLVKQCKVWGSCWADVLDIPPNKVDTVMLDKLEKARQQFEDLQAELTNQLSGLDNGIAAIKKALDATAEQAGAVAEAAPRRRPRS